MKCPECQRENPSDNKFCGQCGALLPAQRVPTVSVSSSNVPNGRAPERPAEVRTRPTDVEPRRARVAPEEQRHTAREEQQVWQHPSREESARVRTAVSGPSFLGLDDDERDYGGRDDLYRSNWSGRVGFLLFVLLVLGALAYMQFRSNKPLLSVLIPKPSPEQNAPPQANGSDEGQKPPQVSGQQQAAEPGAQNGSQTNSATTPQPNGAQTNGAQQPAQSGSQPGTPTAGVNQVQPNDDKSAGDEAKSANASPATSTAAKSDKSEASSGSAKSAQVAGSDEDATSATSASAAESKPATRSKRAAKTAQSDDSDQQVQQADGYINSQNCNQGLSLLRSASSQGNTQAVIKLGALYATGTCVPLDRVIAYHYFSRAFRVEPDNTALDHNRIMLWNDMSDAERQRAMAEDGSLDTQQ